MPIINIPSNCKYSILDGFNSEMLYCETEESQVRKLKQILKNCKIVVQVNITSKKWADMILKHFEVYAYNEIPVGYGGVHSEMQYHITIKNTYSNYGNKQYLRPAVPKTTTDKEKIKQTLTNILKSKRRKTDIVDLLINEL